MSLAPVELVKQGDYDQAKVKFDLDQALNEQRSNGTC
jgi:hypothetical protein